MNMSTRPAELLAAMAAAAKARFPTEAAWAAAAGLPKETLSRLKSQSSCNLRTLGALARAAGCRLVAVPQAAEAGSQAPERFTRDLEDRLLLASARGFERARYLRLAEALHPGVSTPEVFGLWLKRSPLRATRFLPMAKRRRRPA